MSVSLQVAEKTDATSSVRRRDLAHHNALAFDCESANEICGRTVVPLSQVLQLMGDRSYHHHPWLSRDKRPQYTATIRVRSNARAAGMTAPIMVMLPFVASYE